MPTERVREEHGVSKVRKLEVSRVRDGDQARCDLQVSLVCGVPQDPQEQRGSVRRKNSTKNKDETREERVQRLARNKHRRLQCLEVTKKIQEGTWWPFDQVDPEILAMVKPKEKKPEQHEPSPF